MKSKRGIYYNLKESDYIYAIDNFEFVFSSLFYLKLFKNDLEKYIEFEQNKINYKLKNNIDFREMILLNHYKSIEKRGFLVYYKNKQIKDYNFIINLELR